MSKNKPNKPKADKPEATKASKEDKTSLEFIAKKKNGTVVTRN